MKISPRQIYKEYKDGNLEREQAINQLVALINDSDDIQLRIDGIEVLVEIGSKDEQIFRLFENLLISDTHEEIRNSAINAIKQNYIEKAFKPMKWAFHHETSLSCLIAIVSTLGEISNDKVKSFLNDKISEIDIYEFNKSLQNLFETKEIYNFRNESLVDILNNYFIIKHFKNEFKDIDYRVKDGLVISLDLSGISTNIIPLFIGS